MNGLTKYLIVGVPIVLALIAAMVSNDQLSRGRDTALQGEITRVELQQTEQYGSIQTSLGKIEMKLGIEH